MKQLLQSDSKLNNYISSSSSISIIGLEDENNKIILAFFLIYKNPKHFYPCTFVYIYVCEAKNIYGPYLILFCFY
jgi:hypothetical protein